MHIDILIDPFRPGVLEKLGLAPALLLELNPRLLVGRLTGFRRDGRYRHMAGHDINYIAVSGVLSMLGRRGEKPLPAGNLLGDFAGGGAVLFQGLLLALLAREKTGRGQVVQANMVDGSAYLATFPRLTRKTPAWDRPRGENILDGGCPWYDTYETKDGRFVAVGALEPRFFAALLRGLGLQDRGMENSREDRKSWPKIKATFEEHFRSRTRSEWEQIFDGTDACVTPVLDMTELEMDPTREGDHRPVVSLSDTPNLEIGGGDGQSHGYGDGNSGRGAPAELLKPGHGGETTLHQWLGWRRGRDFDYENGGLIMMNSPKL